MRNRCYLPCQADRGDGGGNGAQQGLPGGDPALALRPARPEAARDYARTGLGDMALRHDTTAAVRVGASSIGELSVSGRLLSRIYNDDDHSSRRAERSAWRYRRPELANYPCLRRFFLASSSSIVSINAAVAAVSH